MADTAATTTTTIHQRKKYMKANYDDRNNNDAPRALEFFNEQYGQRIAELEEENRKLGNAVGYILEKQFCTIDELGLKLSHAHEAG